MSLWRLRKLHKKTTTIQQKIPTAVRSQSRRPTLNEKPKPNLNLKRRLIQSLILKKNRKTGRSRNPNQNVRRVKRRKGGDKWAILSIVLLPAVVRYEKIQIHLCHSRQGGFACKPDLPGNARRACGACPKGNGPF